MKILLALKQVTKCYQPLMFMMELAVFDFNVFGTDKKLTTLEDLLHYSDSFMFQKIEAMVEELVHRDLKTANVLISNHH